MTMKTLKVSYQEDQGGWPFVLLTYKKWDEHRCPSCKCPKLTWKEAGETIVDDYHHLSADEAKILAKELLEIAEQVEKAGGT
jgi:hypothetical protein